VFFSGAAWYKLMNRDMGPASRCVGKLTPVMHTQLVSLGPWLSDPRPLLTWPRCGLTSHKPLTAQSAAVTADKVAGKPYMGALFSDLAWQCAATYRTTDRAGRLQR